MINWTNWNCCIVITEMFITEYDYAEKNLKNSRQWEMLDFMK